MSSYQLMWSQIPTLWRAISVNSQGKLFGASAIQDEVYRYQ